MPLSTSEAAGPDDVESGRREALGEIHAEGSSKAAPLPNLVIVGLGKAGTTSLFWYLSQHPDICPSHVKETQFLLPLADGHDLPPLDEYSRHFRRCEGERYRLEASPQYFHAGEPVIRGMQQLLDAPRAIVVLRDPVERLWSTYRFMRSRMADLPADMRFDGYVAACREVWERDEALTPANRLYWTIQGGFYASHLRAWHDALGRDLKVVFFEHLANSPRSVVTDICRWLGISTDPPADFVYSVENRTASFRSRSLQRLALFANRESLLGNHRKLKEPLRRLYYKVNQRRDAERMSERTRNELEAVFAPGIRDLHHLLEEMGITDAPAWVRDGGADADPPAPR